MNPALPARLAASVADVGAVPSAAHVGAGPSAAPRVVPFAAFPRAVPASHRRIRSRSDSIGARAAPRLLGQFTVAPMTYP